MGRIAWLLAFAVSIAIHAALAINFQVASSGDFTTTTKTSVSVAGSLAGVLGSSVPVRAATVEPVKAVSARRTKTTSAPPLELKPVEPQDVASLAPVKPARTTEPVEPRPVEAVEQPTPVKPTEAAPVTAQPAPKLSPVRPSKVSAAPVDQQRARSASKQAMTAFAKRIATALARSRPRRIAGTGRVVIAFTLSLGGRVEALTVQKSSGSPRIDGAAVRAVRRTKFPKPPKHATRKQRSFVVPYYFRKR